MRQQQKIEPSSVGAAKVDDQADQQVPKYSWYALGVLFLVYMINFVDRQILSILANDIKADLALTDAQLGFLYGTAFAIFYALFGIPLGRLADGWNRTRLLAIGLTLWSCMTAFSGLARNFSQLAVARIGVGIGEASASPCAYSLIADWFPQRLRATALSIYSAGLFLGSGLSLVLGGLIVERWNRAFPDGGALGLAGWQVAFFGVGAPGLMLATWVLRLREPVRGSREGLPGSEELRAWRNFAAEIARIVPPFTLLVAARRNMPALLVNLAGAGVAAVAAICGAQLFGNPSQFWFVAIGAYAVFSWSATLQAEDRPTFALTWGAPAFVAIVLAYSAISFVGYTATYWAAPFAERQFALDKSELGLLLGAPAAVGGLLGVIGGGWLADRLQMRVAFGRLVIPALALVLPLPLILIAYRTLDPATFLICSFFVQVATSSALGASAAASQALVLPRMRGTATAIFFLGPTLIGLAFGPFTAGLVSETTGNLGTGVIATLLALPAGIAALLIAIFLAPKAEALKLDRAIAAGEAINPP